MRLYRHKVLQYAHLHSPTHSIIFYDWYISPIIYAKAQFPFRKNNWGVKKIFSHPFFQAVSLLLL